MKTYYCVYSLARDEENTVDNEYTEDYGDFDNYLEAEELFYEIDEKLSATFIPTPGIESRELLLSKVIYEGDVLISNEDLLSSIIS